MSIVKHMIKRTKDWTIDDFEDAIEETHFHKFLSEPESQELDHIYKYLIEVRKFRSSPMRLTDDKDMSLARGSSQGSESHIPE